MPNYLRYFIDIDLVTIHKIAAYSGSHAPRSSLYISL
jgi:hypothetical protein